VPSLDDVVIIFSKIRGSKRKSMPPLACFKGYAPIERGII